MCRQIGIIDVAVVFRHQIRRRHSRDIDKRRTLFLHIFAAGIVRVGFNNNGFTAGILEILLDPIRRINCSGPEIAGKFNLQRIDIRRQQIQSLEFLQGSLLRFHSYQNQLVVQSFVSISLFVLIFQSFD